MRVLLLIYCCWQAAVFASQDDSFYFPDQIPAKANAQSQAWTDTDGSSHAVANSEAVAGGPQPAVIGGHGHDGDSHFGGGFNQYQPSEPPVHLPPVGGSHVGHEFGGGFNQGPPITGPVNPPPYQPYPPFNGGQSNSQANANAQTNSQGFDGSKAQSNAQSNSQGFDGSKAQSNAQASSQNFANGNVISNAISNTQTNGPNGEATASAAAAAAGVTFVNGIPVATASAAASVASTAPGAGVVHSSSSSGGPQQFGPGSNYGPDHYRDPYYGRAPYPGGFNGPYNGPNNIYDGPYGQQSWFYRSAYDKKDDDANSTDTVKIEAQPDKLAEPADRISKSVELDKAPETKKSTVIFKD